VKSAILIDFHNLFMMLGKDTDKTRAAIAKIMRMARKRGDVLEARLFVPIYFFNEGSENTWRFINALSLTFGLEVEACTVSSVSTDVGRRMKDSVDNGVMMHIVRNIHRDIGPELVVFVTGDGDFIKFSTQAQNKGKVTEFWSVDPQNTSQLIKQEGNFQEVDLRDLQTNLFLIALDKAIKKIDLEGVELRALEFVVKLAEVQLGECEVREMSILISDRIGISHADSDRLLEMLTTLGIAEVKLAIKRVINIDYFHSLFEFLRSYVGSKKEP